ncbi:5-oxoprolinase subunit PxpB [Lederbergia sp. NSJ-179]|uniref:5-oxoprolinase subunit PxpB n=1 Tax=Lederbergia sp. NSJ-179 TaxID=2931402 RepID=UPI001FD53E78|nr:5-oxoprolinase subunit PxpB [Lederbergia sp. NSJ-179]MCJ7842602.1 5-oxoprolinase subunit PxpB [Lederbergia sp. NSJ-179]
MDSIKFSPLGEEALVMEFGDSINLDTNRKILSWKKAIEAAALPGVMDIVPAYTTLTIFYNLRSIASSNPYETLKRYIQQLHPTFSLRLEKKQVKEIPVCYEEPYAMDLKYVADFRGLSVQEVVHIHTNREYPVYFLGFTPGFPFLGGMDSRIAVRRRSSPRTKIPAGSVGIAGGQTGIYPLASPGGWQIIGRTPYKLFNQDQQPPTFLLPGDYIRFIAISKKEFHDLEGRP